MWTGILTRQTLRKPTPAALVERDGVGALVVRNATIRSKTVFRTPGANQRWPGHSLSISKTPMMRFGRQLLGSEAQGEGVLDGPLHVAGAALHPGRGRGAVRPVCHTSPRTPSPSLSRYRSSPSNRTSSKRRDVRESRPESYRATSQPRRDTARPSWCSRVSGECVFPLSAPNRRKGTRLATRFVGRLRPQQAEGEGLTLHSGRLAGSSNHAPRP